MMVTLGMFRVPVDTRPWCGWLGGREDGIDDWEKARAGSSDD